MIYQEKKKPHSKMVRTEGFWLQLVKIKPKPGLIFGTSSRIELKFYSFEELDPASINGWNWNWV